MSLALAKPIEHTDVVISIPLDSIIVEKDAYPRERVDTERVDELAQILKAGRSLKNPVKVVTHPTESGRYLLVDGVISHHAAKNAKLEVIPAVIDRAFDCKSTEKGEIIRALLHRASALNWNHLEKPLTSQEKKEAVRRLCEMGAKPEDLTDLVPLPTVYAWAGDILKANKNEQKEKAIALKAQGFSIRKIAEIVKCTRQTAYNWIREFGGGPKHRNGLVPDSENGKEGMSKNSTIEFLDTPLTSPDQHFAATKVLEAREGSDNDASGTSVAAVPLFPKEPQPRSLLDGMKALYEYIRAMKWDEKIDHFFIDVMVPTFKLKSKKFATLLNDGGSAILLSQLNTENDALRSRIRELTREVKQERKERQEWENNFDKKVHEIEEQRGCNDYCDLSKQRLRKLFESNMEFIVEDAVEHLYVLMDPNKELLSKSVRAAVARIHSYIEWADGELILRSEDVKFVDQFESHFADVNFMKREDILDAKHRRFIEDAIGGITQARKLCERQ